MIKKIENEFLSLSFDTDSVKIISIMNKLSGDEYIKCENTAEIFEISVLDSNNELHHFYPHSINNVEAADEGKNKVLQADCRVNDGIEARVYISLKSDEDTLYFNVEILNKSSEYDVVEVLYPRIRGIYLGNTWKDDTIILPHHGGEKTVNPAEEYLKPDFTGMSRAGVKNDGCVNYRELNYCGLASMTWMYYYDDNDGFYIGSYDEEFPLTGLRVEISGDSSHWAGFAIRKYIRLKKGESLRLKPCAISVNCSDWHRGALEYRKWIDNYISMPQNPEYLKEQYALMNMYKFRREGKVYYRFKDIPYIYDYGKDYGINHLFMAGWNRWGFDQNYPEYYPDLELGTSMDLYGGCRYVEENGGIATFYINSRIFDIHSDYFDTIGKRVAIKLSDGSMVHEKYGDYEFTVSCPADGEWQKLITDTAVWMIKAYGARGIYLDQLGSAEPYPCYDNDHSHDKTWEFGKGYLKILKDTYKRIRDISDDTFIMIENCGDIYGSYTWGNLTWNGEVRDEFFNLFKYTFPEFIQVNMINPHENVEADRRNREYYIDIERALLLGSVLWVNPLTKFDQSSENDRELLIYLRKAIEFRKKVNPYIIDSNFKDTDGICSTSDSIKVTRWEGKGFELFIIANNENCGGSFEIVNNYMCSYTYIINGDQIFKKYENPGERISISAPDGNLSFVILSSEEIML